MRHATAVAAALLALSSCGGDGTSSTTTTASTRPASTSTTIGIVAVPGVVGKDLAAARATLAAAGFNRVTTNDGTQKRRVPADDWIVYRQLPPPGERVLTSSPIYLELLQKGERYINRGCPESHGTSVAALC